MNYRKALTSILLMVIGILCLIEWYNIDNFILDSGEVAKEYIDSYELKAIQRNTSAILGQSRVIRETAAGFFLIIGIASIGCSVINIVPKNKK